MSGSIAEVLEGCSLGKVLLFELDVCVPIETLEVDKIESDIEAVGLIDTVTFVENINVCCDFVTLSLEEAVGVVTEAV